MKNAIDVRRYFVFSLLSLLTVSLHSQNLANKKSLRRAESFFGVHFDLHANEGIDDAGKTLTPEMVDTFLTKVKPDFIQIDCKGHPGIASYPTKVGYHVKGFIKDPLKLFREETSKYGVGLYMHYSGLYDVKACTAHPNWAILKANGERSKEKTSFMGSYLDSLLIPQMKELSDYGVDGAWVDGECWALEPDFSEAVLSRFTRETGVTQIPRKPGDPNWPEFIEFNRSLFREHLNKYMNAIHAYNPNFQITSNWAYSSMMPEPVGAPVDFISGDVTPQNGVYRSAFEARCIAPQGKPWDLMAWGFSWNGANMPMNIKSAVQLEQEASQIMAMGGGVQVYYQQNHDLSIKPWLAKSLSEIASFCRARQPYCHKAKPIAQIALLYPNKAYQRESAVAFSPSLGRLQGTLNLFLDNQYSVEILMEHHLTGRMLNYPMIAVPECGELDLPLREELIRYVRGGGKLLLIGTETVKQFQNQIGIRSCKNAENDQAFIAAENQIGAIRSKQINVDLSDGVTTTSTFYSGSDFVQKTNRSAAISLHLGNGDIAAICFNAGTAYHENKMPVLREFIKQTTAKLYPNPKVQVTGSHLVHVVLAEKDHKTFINLINVAGDHNANNTIGYDEIPSLHNLTITYATTNKPSKITLQPEGKLLSFNYLNNKAIFRVPEVSIHSIVEIE